jgi:hypothetical protein
MNNKINWVVALVLVFASITVKAQDVDKENEAAIAAEDWLALVDAGKYGCGSRYPSSGRQVCNLPRPGYKGLGSFFSGIWGNAVCGYMAHFFCNSPESGLT